jgi:hypothetical protein
MLALKGLVLVDNATGVDGVLQDRVELSTRETGTAELRAGEPLA